MTDLKNDKVVYSTDAKSKAAAQAQDAFKNHNFIVVLRLEKSGRKGKTVTVIDELPKYEFFLKELAKELKTKLGTGGTYRMDGKTGIIEIQGDHRPVIRELLIKKGYKCKG